MVGCMSRQFLPSTFTRPVMLVSCGSARRKALLDFEDSMLKKSGIKIAKKYWPQVGEKLDAVIHYLNTDAGEGFVSQDVPVSVVERYMGQAEQVEPVEPLPTSNETVPVVQPVVVAEQAATQSQPAPRKLKRKRRCKELLRSLPRLLNRLCRKAPSTRSRKSVKRARNSGAWKAAHEYIVLPLTEN